MNLATIVIGFGLGDDKEHFLAGFKGIVGIGAVDREAGDYSGSPGGRGATDVVDVEVTLGGEIRRKRKAEQPAFIPSAVVGIHAGADIEKGTLHPAIPDANASSTLHDEESSAAVPGVDEIDRAVCAGDGGSQLKVGPDRGSGIAGNQPGNDEKVAAAGSVIQSVDGKHVGAGVE